MIKAYYAENWKYHASFDSNGRPKDENGSVSTKYCLKISQGNVPVYYSASPYSSFSLDIGNGNLLRRITDYDNQLTVDTVGSYVKTWVGRDIEYGRDVYQTVDHSYLVAGLTISFCGVGEDALMLRFDSDGNFVWNRTWGGGGNDVGYWSIWSDDGGYIITGYMGSYTAGNGDIYLSKFDKDDNSSWTKNP